jgi:hypothetical protein
VRNSWNSPRGRTAPKPARMPVGRNREGRVDARFGDQALGGISRCRRSLPGDRTGSAVDRVGIEGRTSAPPCGEASRWGTRGSMLRVAQRPVSGLSRSADWTVLPEKGLSPSPRRVNRRRGPGVNQPGRGTEICTTSSASRPPAATSSAAGGVRRTSASGPPTTSTPRSSRPRIRARPTGPSAQAVRS